MISACPACRAALQGQQYSPTRYPQGARLPTDPTTRDGTLLVCPLCRLAMRYGDGGTALRVPENDAEVEPGVYSACRDCLTVWAPVIRDRLAADGTIGPDVQPWQLSREQLL